MSTTTLVFLKIGFLGAVPYKAEFVLLRDDEKEPFKSLQAGQTDETRVAGTTSLRLRKIIMLELGRKIDEVFAGEIAVDESYFGGKRKGKRGCAATGKIPVFGLFKRARIVGDKRTSCFPGTISLF